MGIRVYLFFENVYSNAADKIENIQLMGAIRNMNFKLIFKHIHTIAFLTN